MRWEPAWPGNEALRLRPTGREEDGVGGAYRRGMHSTGAGVLVCENECVKIKHGRSRILFESKGLVFHRVEHVQEAIVATGCQGHCQPGFFDELRVNSCNGIGRVSRKPADQQSAEAFRELRIGLTCATRVSARPASRGKDDQDLPVKCTRPSPSFVACTYTVDWHPLTLLSSICSSESIFPSFAAKKRSCW